MRRITEEQWRELSMRKRESGWRKRQERTRQSSDELLVVGCADVAAEGEKKKLCKLSVGFGEGTVRTYSAVVLRGPAELLPGVSGLRKGMVMWAS